MKLKNGIEIISLESKQGKVTLQNKFGVGNISFDNGLAERVAERVRQVSQWTENHKSENFNYSTVNDVIPKPEDAILVKFRALSKVVVPGHWLDWTKDGVLEEGVKLLQGATVYPNHQFWDINNALGSVSESSWDPEGKNANGVPGINATYSIDALMNPKIARGLLWKPFPYIHSTSLTVLFQFEYSHPQLVEERRFWNLLGEEVDGEIVRLIVTKIIEIWEASLVFQGADRLAKKDCDDEEDFDDESLAAQLSETQPKPENHKEKTMKIEKEKREELGIEFDGDEVPESVIFAAAESLAAKNKEFAGVANLAELQKQAAQAATLLTDKRKEVTRLARLAELGSEEGDLAEIISQQIEEADAEKLVKLEDYFGKKAADKFPKGRTSQENSTEIETAGGIKPASQQTVPVVGLHD